MTPPKIERGHIDGAVVSEMKTLVYEVVKSEMFWAMRDFDIFAKYETPAEVREAVLAEIRRVVDSVTAHSPVMVKLNALQEEEQ